MKKHVGSKRFRWLARIVRANQYALGAEVGAATGVTTEYLLRHCPSLKKLVIADDWRPVGAPGRAWAQDNMEEVFRSKFKGERRLTILKGLSWEVANQVRDNSLDFVFIDASHDYESVKKDLDAWVPKVKSGGLISGHDINSEGVEKAVKEKFGEYTNTNIDHVWFVKKAA